MSTGLYNALVTSVSSVIAGDNVHNGQTSPSSVYDINEHICRSISRGGSSIYRGEGPSTRGAPKGGRGLRYS